MKPAAGPPDLPDQAAPLLEALYRATRQRLYAFLWARTRSREDALDLLQELYLRAWGHAGTLEAMAAENRVFWLFAAARRLAIDHGRHRQVVARTPVPAGGGTAAPVPGARLEAAETARVLDGAIRALSEPLRDVLVLTVMGRMTSAEVGAALGLPAGTVRYRLSQARGRLKAALAQPKTVEGVRP